MMPTFLWFRKRTHLLPTSLWLRKADRPLSSFSLFFSSIRLNETGVDFIGVEGERKEERKEEGGWRDEKKAVVKGCHDHHHWSSSPLISRKIHVWCLSLFLLRPALLPKMSSSQFPVSVYNFFSTAAICELLLDYFFDTKTERQNQGHEMRETCTSLLF